MGDMMKKVRSGERLRIPARTFNTFIDTARDFEARKRNQQQDPKRRFASSGIVPVKNASGGDRGRFDILGIDAPIFTPSDNEESFKNQVALKGVAPTEEDHVGRFVVLLEPAKAGTIVPGLVAGVSPVRVDVQNEDHEFADVAGGQCGHLASGTTGAAQILWKEAGTGVKWAVIRVGPPGGGGGPTIVRIVSYSGGVYTVQPVVRSGGAWQDAGSQLAGIHNYGEVQAEEAGYLAGPTGCDIYVPLFEAGDERFLLVHPPRMV